MKKNLQYIRNKCALCACEYRLFPPYEINKYCIHVQLLVSCNLDFIFFPAQILCCVLRLFSVLVSNKKTHWTTICVCTVHWTKASEKKMKTGNSTSSNNNHNEPLLQEPIHIRFVANCIIAPRSRFFFVHSCCVRATQIWPCAMQCTLFGCRLHTCARTINRSQST